MKVAVPSKTMARVTPSPRCCAATAAADCSQFTTKQYYFINTIRYDTIANINDIPTIHLNETLMAKCAVISLNLYLINYFLITFFRDKIVFIEPSKFQNGLRRPKIN
jgi:hypothetical protein